MEEIVPKKNLAVMATGKSVPLKSILERKRLYEEEEINDNRETENSLQWPPISMENQILLI